MKNEKGFTLIELLAVITIMGILMMVAIPTVSRTIENSRKDTFIDMVRQYTSSVQNMWAADNLICGSYPSSAVPLGVYYVEINTMSEFVPVLLEQGGKSPWGNRDVIGVIVVGVRAKNNSREVTFYPAITDGIHGVNIKNDGSATVSSWKSVSKISRGNLLMTNAKYTSLADKVDDEYVIREFSFAIDLNSDGDQGDTVDGLIESEVDAVKCVER